MTQRGNASKRREVFVASDPTTHGAMVGRVDASQFPLAARMETATYPPAQTPTTFSAHLSLHALP